MFTTKLLSFGAPFALVTLGAFVGSIEPALAGPTAPVPAPIIAAGVPALVILGGGYWIIRKLRRPRKHDSES
jgi:hypothetical protein